ncbi:probable protein phosphatase 2C 25 isoform X2 [Ricinus communis]|uniref:probable protein phosphatase 2C 25 isoform X2 n=1 Tax=Ricinus communis TaxID=3988 RepID=UPI00201ADD57|nr:probable protein phosphatase 2C 25 isoform X2 [Ricinus communis]
MPAAVAVHVPDSPIFSSPRLRPPIFCKPCPSPSPSPSRTVLSLTSTSTSPVASSPSSSPKSPLAIPEKAKSGAAVLKRKRPARIDIPVMQGVWGGGLETPRKEEAKISEVMEVEEDCYSVYCKRGKRGHMEDRFSASVNFNGVSKQGFFGVYDGHGGANAADFACKNLEKNVMDEVLNRAVISRGGVAEALTSDHQPSRLDERDRIQSLGGYVDYCHGRWRIQGSLAVTRGIGDKHFKEFVIAEPETQILRINPDCEFLILASDGLWDKVTNQEAVDLIRPLCIGVEKPEPFTACKRLVELALRRCSMDDISVMIIQLGRFIS